MILRAARPFAGHGVGQLVMPLDQARQLVVEAHPLALMIGASLLSQAQSANTAPADTIVLHGRVYTENTKQSWAQAVAIRGPRIHSLAFDPTGPRLVTGAMTGDAAIWLWSDERLVPVLLPLGDGLLAAIKRTE